MYVHMVYIYILSADLVIQDNQPNGCECTENKINFRLLEHRHTHTHARAIQV